MYSGGGHLGLPIGIKIVKFVEDLPMIIPRQYGFNYPSGFREEAFCNIFPIGSNVKLSPAVEDLPMIIPGQFGFHCPSSFREEAF